MKVSWRGNHLFAGETVIDEIIVKEFGYCPLESYGVFSTIDDAKNHVEAHFEIENGEIDVEWHNKKSYTIKIA